MAKRSNILVFNSRDELIILEVNKIVYIQADGNYSNIVMANKLKFTVSMNLLQIEKAISSQLREHASTFVRVGRGFVVNMEHITEINLTKQRLLLSDGAQFALSVPCSKVALKRLKDMMLVALVKKQNFDE